MLSNKNQEKIRITIWNANGIKTKKQELTKFLHDRNIDIALISETHLRLSDKLKIVGYKTIRKDRQTGIGGGVAILIKNRIKFTVIPNTAPNPDTENTGIQINTNRGPLNLYAIYSAPHKQLDLNELDLAINRPNPTLIGGDFNAKHVNWNSYKTNRKGIDLLRYTENRNLAVISPNAPTRITTHQPPDLLDIAIAKDITQKIDCHTEPDLSSDHNPVFITLNQTPDTKTETRKITDWKKFASKFETLPKLITNAEQLEEAVTTITEQIQQAYRQATTEFIKKHDKRDTPEDIKILIKQKRRAQKTFQQTLSPADKTELNRIAKLLKNRLLQEENKNWNHTLDKINENQHPWKIAKALRTQTKSTYPLRDSQDQTKILTDKQKADLFAKSLENQFQENPTINHKLTTEISQTLVHTLHVPEQYAIDPVTTEEIKHIISNLHPRKAPGYDQITHAIIKKLPEIGIYHLVNIFNAMLSLRVFPQAWKLATIIMIHKTGKTTHETTSYRPISLLSSLGKLAERVITNRINPILEQLIPDFQFGFRKKHGTTEQLIRLTDEIATGFNKGKYTGAILLDVAKAFDRVWHSGLLAKLIRAEIPLAYVKLLDSYLQNRMFQVKINDDLSYYTKIAAGVPQGSILGPILYTCYTADIPSMEKTRLFIYADDTAITAQSRKPQTIVNRLQQHVKKVEQWCANWKIALNADKTQAIIFHPKPQQLIKTGNKQIKIQGQDINWIKTVKYLGITLDSTLKFNTHIENLIKKAYKIKNYLQPLLNRKSKLSITNKRKIYLMVIRPVLTYACPSWGTTNATNKKKLQVLESKVLRQLTASPWYITNEQIRQDLKIPPITEFMNRLAIDTFNRIKQNPNPTLAQCQNPNLIQTRRYNRPCLALTPLTK